MTERSVFRSCDLWGVGWDSIQVPGSGSNSGRCKKVCTAGARDSIHAPGHGSNPDGRCKRVNTVPMSYHNTLVLWQKNLCRRCSVAFIETSIQVTWPVLTNQRPVLRSHDLYWPIRGQYSSHSDQIRPIRGQYSIFRKFSKMYCRWKSMERYPKKREKVERLGHVTCVDQLEASIQVLRSRDLCWPIRGQYSSHLISWIRKYTGAFTN